MSQNGIIYGYYIEKGQYEVITSLAELPDYTDRSGFIWLHIDQDSPSAMEYFERESSIPDFIVAELLSEDTRPRVIQYMDGLILILRSLNMDKGEGFEDMISLHILIENNRIITLRSDRLQVIQDIGESIRNKKGPYTQGDLLNEIVAGITSGIREYIFELEESVERFEDEILNDENDNIRNELRETRKNIIQISKYLNPQKGALNDFDTQKCTWLDYTQRSHFNENIEKTFRAIDELVIIKERAALLQEELNNSSREMMNQTMYVLSIVGAIFLPLSFLVGLFGINVGGIPGSKSQMAFGVFCVIMLIIGVIEFLLFKKNKWI